MSLISLIAVLLPGTFIPGMNDGELASQPAHMLIPWFPARPRSNAGHNPLCVLLSAQSSGMTELERNMAERSACGAER